MADRRLFKPRMRLELSYASEMLDMIYQHYLPAFLRRGLPAVGGKSLRDLDIEEFAERIASRMIGAVSVENARSWRQAALQAGNGRQIYRALRAEMRGRVGVEVQRLIRQNAQLIKSLPDDLALSSARYVAAQQQRGMRAETIARNLRERLPHVAESRIRLIARTEVAKAESALTQARSENLKVRWYEWQTSEDQRVRKSHANLDEVLVAWATPPAPEALVGERSQLGHYAPGGCPNCRCLALPLIRLDEVRWPHRVYVDGKITWMSMAAFAQIAGLPNVTRRVA